MRGTWLAACAIVGVALAACESGARPDQDAPSSVPSAQARSTSSPPAPDPVACTDPTRTRLGRTPVVVLGGAPGDLPVGAPSRVPWTEFVDSPELGNVVAMHVGSRTYPMTSDGYLREVTVWSTGIVWFEDYGLRFLDRDGRKQRVRDVPAWYGRLSYAPEQLYFGRGPKVWTLSATDLTPRTLLDTATVVEVPDDIRRSKVRVRVAGSLSPDDPLWQQRYWLGREQTRSAWTTITQGALPLDPSWEFVAAHESYVGRDPRSRTWAAYDGGGDQRWCRTFVGDDGRPVRLYGAQVTPDGRHVVLDHDRGSIVVDTRTGQVRHRFRVVRSYFGYALEDDRHLVLTAYDGPPNPLFDPRDTGPEVSELTWDNVVVRCSFTGACEQAARVPAPQRAVNLTETVMFER